MSLAIFDLDHTILQGDSDSAWLSFLIEKGQVSKQKIGRVNKKFFDDYVNGRLVFEDYAQFSFGILSSIHISKLKDLRKEYFKTKIKPIISPRATNMIQGHKKRGHTVIISTATNEFVTRPAAEYLRVDDLIATQLEKKEHGFTGNYYGIPNFKEGKVTNMLSWLKDNPEHQLATSYFYSDSINDLPLLLKVGYPRPVNADKELTKVSRENNWRILNFYK